MISSTNTTYKDFNDFLSKHNAKQQEDKNKAVTHTRIGDRDSNIYGGSYVIPKEELDVFYRLYCDHVFLKGRKEYLTERQLDKNGPMAVDFDFRYDFQVMTRQHSKEHIQDMVSLYLSVLKEHFIFKENIPFDIFIFEKPNVNRSTELGLTKDGIHMLINIQVDHIVQSMIREQMIEKLPEIWDLPLTNTYDLVLDDGISKGCTNWQLFGSRKPNNEAYCLTQHFIVSYDHRDGEFMMDERNVHDFNIRDDFKKLSVQNDSHPVFEMTPHTLVNYNKSVGQKPPRKSPKINHNKAKPAFMILEDDEEAEGDDKMDITDADSLNNAVEQMLKSLLPSEYEIRELHDYAQILPEKYYQPGSHSLNIQVAFALKHTDERLFLSWIMLRSKASDFDYADIPNQYSIWTKMKQKNDGITKRSIMYWAKQDNFEEYEKVKKNTVNYFIEQTLYGQTEFDKALVLHKMFGDKYVCTSLTNKTWYVFRHHRWEIDRGMTLRLRISREMYDLYNNLRNEVDAEYQSLEANDEKIQFFNKKIKAISEIMINLKKTNDKNNVMREAMELFYDKDFVRLMDTNKMLLCFNNGVIDFSNKTFREGYPQDYITKTTGINYIPFNRDNQEFNTLSAELNTFMEKLFPIPEVNDYMWEHLASCLIGTNPNHTFNIYHGSGSNGKSILTDLMTQALGEYKGTVPITLVTEKRNAIGGTSSEIIQLKGVRYAVMQEPTKDMKMNEGIMKELTGGDPVQGRALYCESEVFEPQFKLVVCTNQLFRIESNDDGTWRRIRKVDFISKFKDEGEEHTDGTQYVFLKDKTLKERLPKLAPVFMSMLVRIAFETNGNVKDCDTVKAASSKYRQGQDHISAFIAEKILFTKDNKDILKKTEVSNQFRVWFEANHHGAKTPKTQELMDALTKMFGHEYKQPGWRGARILYDEGADINLFEDE